MHAEKTLQTRLDVKKAKEKRKMFKKVHSSVIPSVKNSTEHLSYP